MNKAELNFDVFCSYSQPDAENVEKVSNYLAEAGLRVWFDKWELVPGQPWQSAIDDALKKSLSVLVFVGPMSISQFQKQEARSTITSQKQLIPVILPGSNQALIPTFLQNVVAIDLSAGIDNLRELNRLIAILEHTSQENVVSKEMQVGDDLNKLGDYAGALAHYERAMNVAIAINGDVHPLTTTLLKRLAGNQKELGNLDAASENYKKALNNDLLIYDSENDQIASDYTNLGQIFREKRELSEALSYFEKALKIYEDKSEIDQALAQTLNDIGTVLREQREFEKAREYFERALLLDEQVLGHKHPIIAIRLNNLGVIYRETGKLNQAKEFVERALAIDELVFGPEHPDVATTLYNLAGIYYLYGEKVKAKQMYDKARAIFLNSYGVDRLPSFGEFDKSFLATNKKIRVAILENHQSIVDGYLYRLNKSSDIEVIAIAGFGNEIDTILQEKDVDVLITEISIPTSPENLNPYPILQVIPELIQKYTGLSILIISFHEDVSLIKAVMNGGASGYILKDDKSAIVNLDEIIRSIAIGGLHFSEAAYRKLSEKTGISFDLTSRQLEALSLVASYPESTTDQLAKMLGVKNSTFRNLLSGVYVKLGVQNRAAALQKAKEMGLISYKNAG